MPIVYWDETTKSNAAVTTSESARRVTCAIYGWHGLKASTSVSAATANRYIEFQAVSVSDYCMVGVCKSTDPSANMYTGATAHLHYSNGTYYNNGGGSGYGSAWTTGDIIMMCLKNGKLYFGKNGTWYNSANFTAETGFVASGLTGNFFPAMNAYNASVRMNRSPSELAYSPPSGASLFVTPGTVTKTLVLPDGTPVASTTVDWAFFEQTTVVGLLTPAATGTATTDASGVLTLTIPHTDLANGATGALLISNTAGSPTVQCRSHFAPVTISVP